jgi:PAS domain S-box-containing protein
LSRYLEPDADIGTPQSPYRLLLILTATVFLAELMIMFVIEFVFNQSTHVHESILEAVLDASALTLIVFPVLYYQSFRPLLTYIHKHANVEKALRQSNRLLQNTFSSLADGVFVLEMPSGKVSTCNRTTGDIFGTSSSGFLGGTLEQLFIDSAAYAAFLEDVAASMAKQGMYHGQQEMISQNGRILIVDVTVTNILDRHGNVTSRVVVCRDITSQHYAEQRLRLQTAALEAVANGIMITDTHGTIEWVNPAFTSITQYTIEEAIGANANILRSGVHDKAFFRQMWKTIKQGKVWEGELINRKKDGSLYTELQSIAPVRADGINVTHYVAIKQDITQRKEAEAALRNSEERYRSLIETSPDAIVLTDLESHVLFSNDQAARILGLPNKSALIGKNALDFIAPEDREEAQTAFLSSVQGQPTAVTSEYQFVRADGTTFPVEISASVLYDSEDRPVGLTAVARDITTRKQAKMRLERHNHELQILNQLGQNVVSSLNPNTIFRQVSEQIKPLLEAETFTILLKENGRLIQVTTDEEDSPTTNTEYLADPHPELYKTILETRQPQLINLDPSESDNDKPASIIAAPIIVENQVIGLTKATHTRPNFFTDDDLQLMQAATNWAAIAISHAQQHSEIQRRLREAATLAAINQSLNETLDLDSILQLIADSTPVLIQSVERVVIHLLNHEDNLLYPAIWSGQDDNDTPMLFMQANEGIAGHALQSGRLINVPNVQENEHFIPHPTSPNFASLMVAPLQSGWQQLGTISVHNTKPGAFTKDDERLLTRLADSAAVTISTANLYRAELNQRKLSDALAKAAKALNLSLQLNDVLETILQQAEHILNCDDAAIYLMRGGKPALIRSNKETNPDSFLSTTLNKLLTSNETDTIPPFKLILETGKPVLIPETNHDPFWSNKLESAKSRSIAAAPLGVGKDIFGFLIVHNEKPGAFNMETIRRLEALAAHASLAIQNANLYSELKESLSKEKSTRAQLVQAQKLSAMGRMVASVAHELNNPLQTIKNCLFLSQQIMEEDEELISYLEMALSETKRLTNLVLQLRDVYRPDDKTPTKPLAVTNLIEEVIVILRQHLQNNMVTCHVSPISPDLVVLANANQIKQVFINICLNAIEAMQPDGGKLFIETLADEDDHFIGIQIEDTGPGISPENQHKLFEPFFTTKETGTGLGLAICYDIVQKHGGHITIESPPDKGAIFTIWLPRETAVIQQPVSE